MGGRGASSRIGRHGGGVGAGGSGSGTGGVTGGGGGGVVGGGGGATGGTGGGGVGGGGGAGGMPGTQASTAQQQGRFERPGEPLTNKYRDILEDRFNNASPELQQVYDKYVPKGGAVTDLHAGGGVYHPNTNSIELDQRRDSDGMEKADGATWYHEHGHYIDTNALYPSLHYEYWDRLQRDVYNYETRWLVQHGYTRADLGTRISEDEMRTRIGREMQMNNAYTHGVQDIFGGVNAGYQGKVDWGHDAKYWSSPSRRVTVPSEAWANMFDAAFSKKIEPFMRSYLPESFDWFMQTVSAL